MKADTREPTKRSCSSIVDRTDNLLLAAELVLAEAEEILADLPADAPEHEVDDVRDRVAQVQARCEALLEGLVPAQLPDLASGPL
jgi:predicted metal-dependent hydrolase